MASSHVHARIIGDGDARKIIQVGQRADLIQISNVVLADSQHFKRSRQESVDVLEVRNAI